MPYILVITIVYVFLAYTNLLFNPVQCSPVGKQIYFESYSESKAFVANANYRFIGRDIQFWHWFSYKNGKSLPVV